MNGAVYKHYENPGEGNKEEPSQKSSHESQEVSESGIEASETNTSEPVISSETIASEIEHFSRLSSELTELLSNISQKIANSEEQLRVIQSTVDLCLCCKLHSKHNASHRYLNTIRPNGGWQRSNGNCSTFSLRLGSIRVCCKL